MKVTMQDVAVEAGVDKATVSRVLKGDQFMPAAAQLGLQGGGLVLVDLAAQGMDGNFHR